MISSLDNRWGWGEAGGYVFERAKKGTRAILENSGTVYQKVSFLLRFSSLLLSPGSLTDQFRELGGFVASTLLQTDGGVGDAKLGPKNGKNIHGKINPPSFQFALPMNKATNWSPDKLAFLLTCSISWWAGREGDLKYKKTVEKDFSDCVHAFSRREMLFLRHPA